MESNDTTSNKDTNNNNTATPVLAVVCDVCSSSIPWEHIRHHCTERPDYDMCDSCYKKADHSKREYDTTYEEQFSHEYRDKKIIGCKSMASVISTVFEVYKNRPCLGYRVGDHYEWLTYHQVRSRCENFASGLLQVKDMVMIHSANRLEWLIADFSCMLAGLVVVPIHHVLVDDDALIHVINKCEIKCVICGAPSESIFKRIQPKCTTLQHIVVIGASSAEAPTFGEIEEAGKGFEFKIRELQLRDIITIIHTSGSTGIPKGAPFTYALWKLSLFFQLSTHTRIDPLVEVCSDPLAHVSERELVHNTICRGGRVGLVNIQTVFEDVRLVSPCTMSRTPRFWNVLHGKFQETLLLQQFLRPTISEEKIREEVVNEFKQTFGGRLRYIACGGAAMSSGVLAFLQEIFGDKVNVFQGYGTTEVGTITCTGGIIAAGVRIKLEDVPEMGYFKTDLPHPRGELYVKTPEMVTEYYGQPDDTNLYFKDKWFRTGDIVEVEGGKKLRVIDRRKNFFKLSQGEWVAAEKLENTFLNCKFVDQIS